MPSSRVSLPGSDSRHPVPTASRGGSIPDADLTETIVSRLRERGFSAVRVDVDRGAVTLTGRTSTPFERQAAAQVVRRIAGVTRLYDQIQVVSAENPAPGILRRAGAGVGAFMTGTGASFSGAPLWSWPILLLGVLLPVSNISCGTAGDPEVAVHPVSGKVLFGGEPAAGAQIVLHPRGHALPADVAATGVEQRDGTFRIGAYRAGDGAPAGDYVATLQWFKVIGRDGSGGRGPNVLPREYGDPHSSPVRVTVREGSNELPAIEIRR